MNSLSFPKSLRLLNSSQFHNVRKEGCFFKSNNLLFFYFIKSKGIGRLGLSVSRKFAKKAVVRNRVKRLVREAFRLTYIKFSESIDLVVVPCKGISLKVSLSDIQSDFNLFQNHLKKHSKNSF